MPNAKSFVLIDSSGTVWGVGATLRAAERDADRWLAEADLTRTTCQLEVRRANPKQVAALDYGASTWGEVELF